MKQIFLTLVLSATFLTGIVAQEHSPLDRPNEIYGGYGIISVYNFTNNHHDYDPYYNEEEITSPGTFVIGYNRQLGRIVSIGMNFSYVYTSNRVTNHDPYYDTVYSVGTTEHNYISGMTQLTFTYVSKRILRLYSAAALGITVDFNSTNSNGVVTDDKTIRPAGQLTMFGLRIGKALGGFMEFGIGTNAILLVGINYRFKD